MSQEDPAVRAKQQIMSIDTMRYRYGSHPNMRAPVSVQLVPWVLRRGLTAMLAVAAIVSVPYLGKFGPLPATGMLDAWVALFILACFVRGRIYTTATLGLLALYALTRIFPALHIGAPLNDFLQAYKWLFYLVAFALAVGRRWGPVYMLVRVLWVLLGFSLLKALLTLAAFGPGERPGLLLENNFELALFAGLSIVLYRFLGRGRVWVVLLMGVLTVLAGSRSGAVAYLILVLFATTQAKHLGLLWRYLLALMAAGVAMVPLWIFQQRAATESQLDRLNFFEVFRGETSKWDVLNWAFGTMPITPLSDGACFHLRYYESLFSSAGDGSCYSVIFHAFIMRVVFDAGILGLLIAFGVAWLMMRRARVQVGIAVALMAVAIANSLSVSGLNNPYVGLPILLAIVTSTSALGGRGKPRPQNARTQVRAGVRSGA